MPVKTLIQRSRYYDSVHLMQVARRLTHLAGVEDAAVVMATEANKAILRQSGLLTAEGIAASPNDLLIAVKAGEKDLDLALGEVEKLLAERTPERRNETEGGYRPRTLSAARRATPQANFAVISVAGRYAADVAWEALHSGLHVLLFSDNVSLEDEITLKQYACRNGLLLMGPGAGTALINGTGLGFANRVPSGPVGIVSAAGTGLQEVSSLLARYGTGVSQGLGTGGRDLSEAVGGLMMLAGLKSLQEDPATDVIVLVSKPPAEAIAIRVLEAAALSSKPTVVCFLGGDLKLPGETPNLVAVRTLQEAAYLGASRAGVGLPGLDDRLAEESRRHSSLVEQLRTRLKPGQRYLRGLFSGGTLCYEAQVIWRDLLPEPIFSNAPLSSSGPKSQSRQLADSAISFGHTVLDLGEEEFTIGRLHPMIDSDLRIRRLLQEAADPQVAVVAMDVVLGYGAHPNPASELGPAVSQAHEIARRDGRGLVVIASVTGTRDDPQGYDDQVRILESSGTIVCDCNASAARLAGRILCVL